MKGMFQLTRSQIPTGGINITSEYEIVELRRKIDHEKLVQIGLEREESESECHEDNIQYLREMARVFRKMIRKIEYAVSHPSSEGFEPFAQEIRDSFEAVESKREKSEEILGEKFASTIMMEKVALSKEEQTILKLLYATRNVGIEPLEPGVKGEVLIALLNILHGTKIEKARNILHSEQKLSVFSYIHPSMLRNRDDDRSGAMGCLRISHFIEGKSYEISERGIDVLLGILTHEDISSFEESREDRCFEEVDNYFNGRMHLRGEKRSRSVRKVETPFPLSDVVLADGLRDEIKVVMTHIQQKEKIYDEWNLGKLVGTGKGINILFTGPPGTGKTLTAKALGNELGMEVYMLEFNKLINCYYGETEKNVDALFQIFEEENRILLVDEADGILNQRGASITTTDATENRIVNIILQKLEEHSGVVIFTSNLASGMDKALERRFALKVVFSQPKKEERKKIWDIHIPKELPLANDVDLDELASMFKFSGGKIKNSVLNAARRALTMARDEVNRSDFIHACKIECKGGEAMEYNLKDEEDVEGYR